jgi:3-isopropylmalate/(R)-2-methylmalate dehydratase small subunit
LEGKITDVSRRFGEEGSLDERDQIDQGARAVPVHGADIDTDRIIPARFLRCVSFDGSASTPSRTCVCSPTAKPVHPFDDADSKGAKVLVANSNFGCGSSREHAPQSIARAGFRAVLAESFAEIFFGNC